MNQFTIEMPLVEECLASQCAYNHDSHCHARAITIGDGASPGCDTYLAGSQHTHQQHMAGIGACKIGSCKFNEDLECMAQSIQVDKMEAGANCITFARQ